MAGGRKQQKKRRKKNWKTVLEGCFSRNPFAGNTDAPKLQDSPVTPEAEVRDNIRSPNKTQQPQRASSPFDETPTDFNHEGAPLRGILKKSPTFSSSSSAIYAEAAVDVPDFLLNSSHEWCQTRPAYLVNNSGKYTSPDRLSQYNSRDDQPRRYIYDCRQAGTTGYYGRERTFRKRPNSFNECDSVYLSAPYSGRRFNESSEVVVYDKFHPAYDTYNQTYEALKDRLQKRSQGPQRTCSDNVKYGTNSGPQTPNFNRDRPARWSYPRYELEQAYSRPLPTPPGQRKAPALPQRNRCPDDTYVQLQEIRQRKQQQRTQQQQRPVSAPPASWHGASISKSEASTSPCLGASMLKEQDLPLVPRRLPGDFLELDDHRGSNRYIASALPRSRDPIRKPMGSQYCPYSNPLYQSVFVDDMDSRAHREHSPAHGRHTKAPDVDSLSGRSSVDSDQTVEISHIYATVTRSNTKAAASSYVYASISWKRKHGSGKNAPERSSSCRLPDVTPPPIPPRLWGDSELYTQCTNDSTNSSVRPPLPSYEEVIESRIRYGRRRPVSWSENSPIQETERKREAFMQLLAQRYPQYADKIAGTGSSASSSPTPQSQPVEKPARARDVQRRRTAVVTYDPGQAGQTLEYDDLGTMSDLELPSFQRGGFMRTSLPIVRSASTSLERPLGLVFLVYGDQTKKSLLPNEITTLDTVRALFVRAFPNLTLEMLESPRNKIYLLDPATNIYFQLEDLGEIKDRSVLKIHETDSNEPQKVKERQEVRGRTVQMPASRSRQGYGELPVGHGETFTKAHSLPPQAAHNYSELMQDQRGQWEMERRSRSRTPEPAERPRSLSAGATSRQRFSHSPDRLPTPERGPLNPIPENRQLPPGYRDQGNYYESVAPANYRGPSPYPSGIYEAPAGYPGYPPASTVPAQQTYVARSTRAAPLAHPQRAVAPGADMRQGVPSDAGYTRSQGYRVPPGDGPGGDTTRNRIEKMEQQLANLTAWVHYQKSDGTRRDSTPPPRSLGSTTSESSDTFPASSASKHKGETPTISTIATTTNNVVQTQGLSDIPDGLSHTQRSSGLSSRESTPLSAQAEASFKVAQLRSDLHVLRRQQQLNMEAMRDEFMAVFTKVKKVLSSVPGAENQVNFHKRTEATVAKNTYLGEKQQADKELSDLEASVEELRTDVISRQCRVNANDVEGMALLLSNITKSLADIKARFPAVNSQMMEVLEAERKVIENEEKFLKDEPGEIENSLKRCKKLTGTLYTLKRLASVQDHRPPSVPSMPPTSLGSPLPEQKTALLENIRAVVPDHDHRVQQMEAADASRERKKKISSQQEALKFGKSLEMATKNLRPSSTSGSDDGNKDGRKNSDGYSGGQVKPAVPAKPILSSSSSPLHTSPTATSSSSTVTAANVASVKPSFSAALTTAKSSSDKPTATVSAMTAGVADTVTTTVTRMTEKESGQSGIKGFPNSSTQTSGNLTNTVHGGTGTVTQTVKVGTHSPKKKDASIYTYQVCGPVSPVFPLPPDVFTDNGVSNGTSSSKEMEGKSKSDLTKKGSVSFSNPPVTGSVDASSPVNGHSDSKAGTEKVDLATQKQNARSAFFSSLNSPPTSPSSKRDSACLDPGPVVSPGLVGKVTPGPTINLVLSGTASPKSPTSPGSFNISPPEELKSPPAESKTTATSSSSSAPLPSPTRGIPRFVPESKSSSFDSHSSPSSQTDAGGGKQKKVPPPPPPRKGSRPTSACISPVNGGTQDPTAQETPKFVGGILGQHRLSGGPLSSTPKPASQQKPVTQFEKDLASGVYANMNRPDVQNQKSSPQQMISEANAPGTSSPYRSKESSQSSSQEEGPPIPPPPSVTIALDREERGSSSESTSSSSGTSMGSQQSVIHVARSASVIEKGTGKPKPEPPRRQSSLLSKFTGSRDSKNKMNNGKAKVNGVDL